ncbi:MAG: bacillithiol biosynthesis cysteine-adding enzyme BshC [Pseudomonadota bacterium]
MGRPFSNSYVAGEPSARNFIPLDIRSPDARADRTRAAASRGIDPALAGELTAQQARLPPSPGRDANLAALLGGGTAVVATGQQIGLFLGPLYSFYKAASAVAVARALAAESGVRVVPLFWLQTEDHDFAEIASCTIAGADGAPARLSLPDEAPAESRVSVAHRRLGPDVDRLLGDLAAALPPGPAADETLALLRAHYRAGQPLAAAFGELMARLFADDGLLVLDPRVAAVARLALPIVRRAIVETDVIGAELAQRASALETAGFDAQIPVRPDCSLVFFHRDRATGPRHRLSRSAGGWQLVGCDHLASEGELAEALAADPLRFSTSALLRPILQDTLLPTAAYVGGPAEVSYFAQMGPLYARFALSPPLIVPRARFLCLDARSRRLLGQLGLSSRDVLAGDEAALAAQVAPLLPPGAPDPDALAGRVRQLAQQAADLTRQIAQALPADRNLERAAARTRGTVAVALERLLRRYRRTLSARDTVTADRLTRLRQALAPGGVPQERVYAWPSLAGRHGPAALRAAVLDRLAAIDPFAGALQELEL